MQEQVRRWVGLVALTGLCGLLAAPASGIDLLVEDFEGLTLKDATSPTETAAEKVWTDGAPAGWTRDNSTTPAGSPAEFFGWTFVDKDWWVQTASDQNRSQFTLGSGVVAVADPDEYDDGTNIDDRLFNAFLSTPPIDLTGIAANSVVLSFDSSWRNEETMDGFVDVSYDGGATFQNVLFYDSSDPVFAADDGVYINRHLDLNLDNPSGGTMIVQWGLVEGSNDWWFAVDNVRITGVPEPATGVLAGCAGLMGLWAWRRRRRSC